jgi:HEAT repeat protein
VPKKDEAPSKKFGRAMDGQENLEHGKVSDKKPLSAQAEFDILHVRRVVAGNPNTPTQVLARLAADHFSVIRRHVAQNPRTSADVLRKLAQDHDMDVRLAVADNLHTPPDTLALLATDPSVDVRYDLAENRHLPEHVLIELTKDDNPYVRFRALKTLQMVSPDSKFKAQFTIQDQSEPNSSRHRA